MKLKYDNMAAITNKRKVLSVKGKVEVTEQIANGKRKADMCQKFGVINSVIQMVCKNRTTVISAFERNRSRIKGYSKAEQSDVDEVLLKWLQQKRSDNVQ